MSISDQFGSNSDPSLAEPIVVRRKKKYGRKILIFILLLLPVLSASILLRLMTMKYPIFSQRAKVSDGWTTLRGVFNVSIGHDQDASSVLSGIFKEGMDFAVISNQNGVDLKDIASNAPLATIPSQDVVCSRGHFVTLGMNRHIEPNEAEAGDTFRRLRKAGGWSVIIHGVGGPDRWKAWDEMLPEGFEFLSASRYSESVGLLARIARVAGSLLSSPAGQDFLGVRPNEALARWDDYLRKGRVLGVCGIDSRGSYESPLTFVLVQDGLGPYGADEVRASLFDGHFYCAIPIYGDCSGFRFFARPSGGGSTLGIMGDRVKLGEGVELWAGLNLGRSIKSKISFALIHDGKQVARVRGNSIAYEVKSAGAYRVEVSVSTSGIIFSDENRVFIYSNPIFIE